MAMKEWTKNANIIVVGPQTAERLPIFSLVFRHQESGTYLHHNYIACLLNDLYGIQVGVIYPSDTSALHELLRNDDYLAQMYAKALNHGETTL